jgi:hypothetical protein
MSEKEKTEQINLFDDRIITLPSNQLSSFFKSYQSLKSNPSHPFYDGIMKMLMSEVTMFYILGQCEDESWSDSWKQSAKRIRRCQNPQQLPMSNKLIKALIKNEKRIRTQNREHMILFDIDGKTLDEEVGSFDRCGVSYGHTDLPKGTYVEIHNHPLGHDSFSKEDINFSLNRKIPITRVVTLDGTHEIMFDKELLSDYYEITKILSYYSEIENKQRESDEYKFIYEVAECKNSLGKKRNRLIDKCNNNDGFAELYKLEQQAGFHELGRKASMEAISNTAKEFGFIYKYYPIK